MGDVLLNDVFVMPVLALEAWYFCVHLGYLPFVFGYLLFHLSIACDGLFPIDCLPHLQFTFHWPLCSEISTLRASHAGQELRRLPCA